MSTIETSINRLWVVILSVGYILAPITFAISDVLDRLSPPDDGADIGAGLVLMLSGLIFVCATGAFVVALVLHKLSLRQALCVAAVAAGSFLLMAWMWTAA
ncbi:MAG: hypothetical protein LH645_03860 [Actinomycetia bacterium]|nr:hypothetical protein [Actinomycetes bacterium]